MDIQLYVLMPLIYFIYGMSFFMIGVTIFVENFSTATSAPRFREFLFSPLGYLSLFGFFHGLYTFTRMHSILYSLSFSQDPVRLLLLSVTFYFLFKFALELRDRPFEVVAEKVLQSAQTGTSPGKSRKNGVRARFIAEAIFGAVLVLIISLVIIRRPERWLNMTEVFIWSFIGFPAALLASFSLFRSGRNSLPASRKYLTTASAGFFFYAVSVLVVPKDDFFPASWLNDQNFIRALHFPVQILRSCLAMLIIFSLFRFFRHAKTFSSIRFKAIVHAVIAVAIPAIFVISVGLSLIAGALLKAAVEKNEKIAALASGKVESFLEDSVEKVDHYLSFDRLAHFHLLTDLFTSLVRENTWIDGIVFYDKNGMEMLRVEQHPPSSPVLMKIHANKAGLTELLGGGLKLDEEEMHSNYSLTGHNKDSVILTAPMTIGWMALDLDLDILYKSAFKDLMSVKGRYLVLLNERGDIVAPEHFERREDIKFFGDPLSRDFRKPAILPNDARYSVFVSGIGSTGWSVAMMIPRPEIVDPIFRIYRVFLYGAVAVYLCGLVLGLLFVRNVTKPLGLIMERLEEIGRGNTKSRLSVITGDEMQFLAEEVEKMARVLAEKSNVEKEMMKMEKIASIGRLAAGIAHEVNNPLGIIAGYCSTLLMETDQTDRVTKDLKMIEKQTFRCKEIVNELLIFARDTKKASVCVDVCGNIREALALLPKNLIEGKIKIIIEPCPDAPLIWGDPGRLHQLFINLSVNALDAMGKEGGSLDIHVRTLQSGPGRECEIVFADTGAGIAAENMERIFEPFFTTKEVGKGTGLGLYIAYVIVSEHRGSIRAESVVGEGTTFHITFPVILKPSENREEDVPSFPKQVEHGVRQEARPDGIYRGAREP